MGNNFPGADGGVGGNGAGGNGKKGGGKKGEPEKKRWEPPAPTTLGRKKKRRGGSLESTARIPSVTPHTRCKLRLLKLERIKDFLLMEEEFIANQERLRPQDEKMAEERSMVEDLRGTPMGVSNLDEIIDDNHAIVSSATGPAYYVNMMSFVDKDQLELGCSVLTHHKVSSVVGLLTDEVDPLVKVMKVDKAPLESYADIGGLEAQIQEIKEAVELPLTRPELYEEIGIPPPKGVILYGPPGTGKVCVSKQIGNEPLFFSLSSNLLTCFQLDIIGKGCCKSNVGNVFARCWLRVDSKVFGRRSEAGARAVSRRQ
jgi:26S proteasome regulatory subunit T2